MPPMTLCGCIYTDCSFLGKPIPHKILLTHASVFPHPVRYLPPLGRTQGRRIGRGIGSSKGKTSGRGHKGQKARSGGNIHPSFEGGQTKFYKVLPKRGFKNSNATPMLGINVGTLQDYVDMGRLDPNKQPLTIKDLVDAGVTKTNSIDHGVKLLAGGSDRFKTPLVLEVSRASDAAIQAVEAVGGEVATVHYNKLALRALLKPHKFDVLPKQALPPPRLMTYYRNYKNRGYLSPQMQMKKLLRMRPELANSAGLEEPNEGDEKDL